MRYRPLPPIPETPLKAQYRGYYDRDAGRLRMVFFGAWVGMSLNSCDEALNNVGLPVDWGDQPILPIECGTYEVLS